MHPILAKLEVGTPAHYQTLPDPLSTFDHIQLNPLPHHTVSFMDKL